MSKIQLPALKPKRQAWNKGRLIGQKRPLLAKQVWAIRARLELAGNPRDLALFNLAIDSKLRGCDLVQAARGLGCSAFLHLQFGMRTHGQTTPHPSLLCQND
tara:strand:- start:1191 stop:1496 length:306 start_codon:yes stop_codon:yes gene_type:complete